MDEDRVRLAFLDGFAQGVKAAIGQERPLTGHSAWDLRRCLHLHEKPSQITLTPTTSGEEGGR